MNERDDSIEPPDATTAGTSPPDDPDTADAGRDTSTPVSTDPRPTDDTPAADAADTSEADHPADGTTGDADEAADAAPSDAAGRPRRDRVMRWVGGVVLVAGIAALGYLGYTRFVADDAPDDLPAMQPWSDQEVGLALRFPQDWESLDIADEQIRLVATPDRRDSMLVRVADLTIEVEPETIDGVRQFTEDLVTDGTDVQILQGPQRVELAGLPGWYYFYRFEDPASGDVGVHSHYFLFDGNRMIVLVFQALPDTGFADLAPTFDAIAESLEVTG